MDKITENMNIVHYGGNWPNNIGNAFIDYGSMASIKDAVPTASVLMASKFPQQSIIGQAREIEAVNRNLHMSIIHFKARQFLLNEEKTNIGSLPSFDFFLPYVDAITLSGTCLSPQFLASHMPVFKKAQQYNVAIIVNGGGMEEKTYSRQDDIERTIQLLSRIQPDGIIARDRHTYETFYGNIDNVDVYLGVDCGFFLDEYIQPFLFTGDYVAINFDSTDEPDIDTDGRAIVRTHHGYHYYGWPYRVLGRWRENIHLTKPHTFISELPEDYITIYANASEVHSDRVHGCVASMMYGTPARLYKETPRGGLFEHIGLDGITKKLTTREEGNIEEGKEKHLSHLKKIIQERGGT